MPRERTVTIVKQLVFLDRDGVINHDSPHYIKSWEEFRFIPGSLDAMADMTRGGCDLFIVTNQSMIGRGMVPLAVLQQMHRRMQQAVAAAGGRIRHIFHCPHHPNDGCACRKPEPGMILTAKDRYRLDLSSAVMIGDNVKDILCGRRAGCGSTILVRTGSGVQAEKELRARGIETIVAEDLSHAARIVLAQRDKRSQHR